MDTSMLLAGFIGPYMLVVGVGLLVNLGRYPKLIEDFFANTGLIYLSGLFAFLAGLAIVNFHNLWSLTWPLIITIIGWAALLKGTILVVRPSALGKMGQFFAANPKRLIFPWVILLAIGVFLTVKAFG